MDSQAISLKKMLLNATLLANLDTLKVYMPEVYTAFKDYKPESAGVVIDENGNIDLYHNEKYIYKGNAESVSQQQASEFLKAPLYFNLQMEKLSESTISFEHQRILQRINNRRKQDNVLSNNIHDHDDRLDLVCMLGAGLGYQIEALFNLRKIKYFQLYEPTEDIFYAMLHCIELRPIFEHCIANGGHFTICIGNDDATFINQVNKTLHKYGHFNLPNFYIYKHYESKTNDAVVALVRTMGYRFAFGFGFMEDEIIGFNHTLDNLKLGYKALKRPTEFENQQPERPVFVVGNGPSLDSALAFLKKNSDDIIVISCGTAIRALLKNGIKPDIHIEMERILELLPIMKEVERQQENSSIKLKDVQIIALNTVYPELLKLFKSPLIIPKLTDAGGALIEQLDSLATYASPRYSNPTCSNTAMVLATSLGFQNIYMVGNDYGYVSNKQHHSKDSVYYDEKSKEVDAGVAGIDRIMTDKIQRKGNFRELVFTNEIFDASRLGVEMLLASYDNLNVFNCADGAEISGATPLPIDDVDLSRDLQAKDKFLDKLLSSAFDNNGLVKNDLVTKFDESFHVLKVTMGQLMAVFDKKISTKEELSDAFFEQHALLVNLKLRKEYKLNYIFLQGSFKYLQTYIMANCFYYTDATKQEEFIAFCIDEFKSHIEFLYKKLISSIT